MKKSLLALAVLGAFAGVAQAQTSVTIYGSFDGGVRHLTNVNAAGDSNWTVDSRGTYNNNRLGFKGVEDLGGGLNAHFVLESGFMSGSGKQDVAGTLFQRTASVGLGGAWGSLDIGRQYSVNFKTIGSYDPFSYKYTGIVPLAAQGGLTRLDNDLQYTGTFGAVTVRAEHAFGEQAGSFSNAATNAVGATYAEGAITVGGAFTQRKNSVGTPASYQDQRNWTLGGAYTTGPVRVALGYADNKQDQSATTQTRTKDWWLGGSYAVSAETALTAGYYETKSTPVAGADVKSKLFIVGGTYALSKRTNLYADIDNRRFDNGTATQNGLSAGINHLF